MGEGHGISTRIADVREAGLDEVDRFMSSQVDSTLSGGRNELYEGASFFQKILTSADIMAGGQDHRIPVATRAELFKSLSAFADSSRTLMPIESASAFIENDPFSHSMPQQMQAMLREPELENRMRQAGEPFKWVPYGNIFSDSTAMQDHAGYEVRSSTVAAVTKTAEPKDAGFSLLSWIGGALGIDGNKRYQVTEVSGDNNITMARASTPIAQQPRSPQQGSER